MKPFQSLLIIAFVLLSTNIISAQYGNGGYGNGYGNGYGSNRRMNSGMDQSRAQDKPKEIPVEVTVGKIMERLKPELILDELQVIAISNIFNESIRTQGMLIKAEVSQDEKIKNIQALSESTDRKVMELLNKDQKEKYIVLNEEAKNPKKSKSKKKSN
ncbi:MULTISPECIES: hypothetical protein [Flavobacterium]|uniref:Uncharacterized protein n=1 Tax=Flavobacterium ranwuense TaxID=2541725 RepID=A0ABY2DSS7_9FLAO|nr:MULTISPECIES: hypothetical protein [Flavobacterium]TDE30308.1 hypothetical protein E0I61_04755 [Flavobacterium ranwuense]TDE51025.1 hypothetical protein E0H99_13075 [Flavobacterium sp. GT3P67]